MIKAVKIRLYPNKTQEDYISKLLGSYRFVYNQCLDKKMKSYANDKVNLGLKELGNFFHQELTKNPDYKWLQEHNTKVLKQSVINLLDSYKRFFVDRNGFPKFKSKHDNNQSCRFPLDAISKKNIYSDYKITLTSDLKKVKFKCSNKYHNYLSTFKDNIKSGTLTKTKSDKYFLSILIDLPIDKILPETDNIIGIDLGVKDFVITSEGEIFENIKIKRNNKKKIRGLNKSLSRKVIGSKNKEKCRIKLALFHEKLNNIKENYLHNVSNQLLNENQVMVMENLNVRGMMKNHNLAKSIQELSLNKFKTMLKYKSIWYGRDLVQIDRWFPSSKLCNCCGYKNDNLSLKDRIWTCPDCGEVHDRDLNAAINIRNEGLKLYNKSEIKVDDYCMIKKLVPIRCGELTPLESSDYTLVELGNKINIESGKI
jgi:putative transposase